MKDSKEFIDNLDLILEEVENTMTSIAQQELMKGQSNPQTYIFTQRNNTNNLTKKLMTIGKAYNNIIDDTYKKEMTKILESDKTLKKEDIKKNVDRITYENRKKNELSMSILISSILFQQSKIIENISSQQIVEMVTAKPLTQLETAQQLYNNITESIQKYGGVENIPIVRFGDRNYSYKTYVEQQVRTQVTQESTKITIENNRNIGYIFFICDTFGNSAKDHADYQGKIYIDDEWQSTITDENEIRQIQDYIDSNNILTIKQVTEGDPYLCTRPNCRHRLHPVPTSQVLGEFNIKSYINKNNLNREGEYNPDKAKIVEKQRYNERMIRKYKQRLNLDQQSKKNAPKGIDNSKNNAIIKSDKELVRKWQSTNKRLVDSHNYLERDYDRESVKNITTDLGYRINKRYK